MGDALPLANGQHSGRRHEHLSRQQYRCIRPAIRYLDEVPHPHAQRQSHHYIWSNLPVGRCHCPFGHESHGQRFSHCLFTFPHDGAFCRTGWYRMGQPRIRTPPLRQRLFCPRDFIKSLLGQHELTPRHRHHHSQLEAHLIQFNRSTALPRRRRQQLVDTQKLRSDPLPRHLHILRDLDNRSTHVQQLDRSSNLRLSLHLHVLRRYSINRPQHHLHLGDLHLGKRLEPLCRVLCGEWHMCRRRQHFVRKSQRNDRPHGSQRLCLHRHAQRRRSRALAINRSHVDRSPPVHGWRLVHDSLRLQQRVLRRDGDIVVLKYRRTHARNRPCGHRRRHRSLNAHRIATRQRHRRNHGSNWNRRAIPVLQWNQYAPCYLIPLSFHIRQRRHRDDESGHAPLTRRHRREHDQYFRDSNLHLRLGHQHPHRLLRRERHVRRWGQLYCEARRYLCDVHTRLERLRRLHRRARKRTELLCGNAYSAEQHVVRRDRGVGWWWRWG